MLNGISISFGDGDVVFRQGDAAADMYLIRQGQVRITRMTNDGVEVEVAVLGPGDFFGELALFDPGPRSATATAIGALEVEAVDRPTFMEALSGDDSLKEMVAEMSDRIRSLAEWEQAEEA